MIELLQDLPAHVVGFRATGKVTKDDYEKVVIPSVDSEAKKIGKLNFLLILDTDVANFSIGAWLDDALVGLKHFAHWHRIAIVSHQKMVNKVTDVLGHLIPGQSKGFLLEETEAAKKWVAE